MNGLRAPGKPGASLPYGMNPETPAMFWTFDRALRLQELVDRAREQERFLLRERCDVHAGSTRGGIDNRLLVVRHRLRAWTNAARKARRAARADTITV